MTVSPTLAINEEIARRRESGLHTVALGFGEASIPVHPALVDRLAASADVGAYGPVAGLPELRQAAAGYWTRRDVPTEAGQVLAGPGTKPLLFTLFQALGGPVALPRPSWVSYAAQTAMLGLETMLIPTLAGQGGVPNPGRLDTEAQRLAAAGTPLSAVLVTIPDNPTGTIASDGTIRHLCAVVEKHDLVVICDEIYSDLVHDGSTALSPAALIPDRTIATTGLSKNLALGGWRIGVARFPAHERFRRIQAAVTVAASEIWSAPANPVQRAAAWAFTEPDILRSRIEASRLLHGRVARAAADCFRRNGVQVPEPKAGFYLYPSFAAHADVLAQSGITTSDDLAHTLLHDHGIATLAGTAFGDDPENLTLRIATPMLYGADSEQRELALRSDAPASLPWVSRDLTTLDGALAALTSPGRVATPTGQE